MVFTILCKDIINKDLNAFKTQISTFSFMSNITDDTLTFIQKMLLTKYGNSNIRYETQENFLNALSMRIYDIAPAFEKRLAVIKDALQLANENYYKNLDNFKDVYDIDTTLDQTETSKQAETPTAVKASTDFVDKYTNNMSKNVIDGSTTDDRVITHNADSTSDLIAKINELENLQSLTIEKFTNKFNDLFVVFL